MDKKFLVIFYSRTGTTKKIAREIANALSCDIEEIIDKKDRSGVRGFMSGGRDAMKRELTEINDIEQDPSDYDVIVIGTPVWASNMTPAIRTYISKYKEKFKNVAFFCTTGGTGIEKTLIEMEVLCGKKPVATVSLTVRQIKNSTYQSFLNKFVENLQQCEITN
ncbi:MAG TPA: flavodoxin [bacterium]|nr:flavodoxin [bacterium]HOL50565.1 flavodoxin [bacterium]HPO52821.1 flavodoxin [bacterium]HXK45500.1 flavodoxin [bacterium]